LQVTNDQRWNYPEKSYPIPCVAGTQGKTRYSCQEEKMKKIILIISAVTLAAVIQLIATPTDSQASGPYGHYGQRGHGYYGQGYYGRGHYNRGHYGRSYYKPAYRHYGYSGYYGHRNYRYYY
jgi:hypothetical protein